jgi:hypothetical protein
MHVRAAAEDEIGVLAGIWHEGWELWRYEKRLTGDYPGSGA